MPEHKFPDLGPCQRCVEQGRQPPRTATTNWADGGVLAYVHGASIPVCEICCITLELDHCRTAAARVPALEQRLEQLLKADA